MNKTTSYILLLILLTILTACRIDAKWLLESEESLLVQTYQPGRGKAPAIEITKNEEKFAQTRRWLEQNGKGWNPSPATYIPGTEVRGKRFVLNFLHNLAVLNFQDPDGKYHQYVKGIKETDYQYLPQR